MQTVRYFLFFIFVFLLTSCHQSANKKLGFRKDPAKPGIVGGTNAIKDEFPFMVNIWLKSPQDGYKDHLCGGSLIHPNWVLTAAHCVLDDDTEETKKVMKPDQLMLFIGSNSISGEGGALLKAKAILIHPQFSWPYHDVALIELSTPVMDIAPVLLNHQDLDFSLGLEATVVGWGVIDRQGKIAAPLMKKTLLPLISREICAEDNLIRKKGWIVSSDIICADTNQNNNASCHGDSGGPLVVMENNQYVQIGIVSWGSACNGNPRAIPSNVEGHSSVSDAYPWVWRVVYDS